MNKLSYFSVMFASIEVKTSLDSNPAATCCLQQLTSRLSSSQRAPFVFRSTHLHTSSSVR